MLAPLDRTNAYILLANILMKQQRPDGAAVVLVEASLISGNRAILGNLQKLYQAGLDPQGCAFAQTPNGPILNIECAPVKKELCAASADLIKLYTQLRRADLADQTRASALQQFTCTAEDLK